MARDERVFIMREDIGVGYGRRILRAAKGLLEKYRPERVIDTPISESAIAGCAVGAAFV
jgi:pyruvate/2-oxoglutarate/acetoin dehydrogenase E1 component